MDWSALRRIGLCQLGLRPADFWALTPIELLLMLGVDPAQSPMERSRLAELERLHPDQSKET